VQNEIDSQIFILMLRQPWAKSNYLDRVNAERVLIHSCWRKIRDEIEDETPELELTTKTVRQNT
jgi:hypothetical protein